MALSIYGVYFIYARTSRVLVFLSLFFVGMTCGVLRYEIKDIALLPKQLTEHVSHTVSVEGIIVEEPRDRGSLFQYELYSPKHDERFIVRAERLPQFRYGDEVIFTGILRKPEPFVSDSGKVVPYDNILSRLDIYFILDRAEGVLISTGNGNWFRSSLFAVKHSFIRNIETVIHEPYATFVTGVVFGSDNTLGEAGDRMFRTAGISHIVVLSGYNLTLVATIIFFLLRSYSIYTRVVVASVSIVLFAIMAGGGASVVRATIMSLFVLIANIVGRRRGIGRVFILTGVCMLLFNPKLLHYDLGFQLSFLATAGLIWLSPRIERMSLFVTEKYGIRDVLASTISAQVAVLPLLVYSVGTISPWALVPNILVLPFIPALMCIVIGIGMISFIHPLFSLPFAFLAWIISVYIFFVAQISSSLPFASMNASIVVVGMLCLLYGWGIWKLFPSIRVRVQNFLRLFSS